MAALAAPVALVIACGPGGDDGGPSFPDGSLFRADGSPGGADSGPTADANQCPTQPCDIHEQCGCGVEQACDIEIGGEGTACREVTAFGGHADTCDSFTDCRPGFICVSGEPNFCRKYCQSDEECPGAGALCRIALADRDLTMCGFDCNPSSTSPDDCPEARAACYFRPLEDGGYYTSCNAPGSAGNGDLCPNGRFDCQAGHTCVVEGDEQRCRRTCEIGDATQCGVNQECRRFEPRIEIGEREFGVCRAAS